MISKAESRHWIAYLKRQVAAALDGGASSLLAGLSFLAVYREAAETVLFTQALLLETGRHAREVWTGAAVGTLAVAATALLMSRDRAAPAPGPLLRRLGDPPLWAGDLLRRLRACTCWSRRATLAPARSRSPRSLDGDPPDLNGLLVQLADRRTS